MRPAKFFLALLFGAAVLITFLKLLFFALMATVVFGSLYMIFRAGAYMARYGGQPQHHFAPNYHYPSRWNNRFQEAQPMDPFLFQQGNKQGATRHIEVL